MPIDSPVRAEEGIPYVVQKLAEDGHVYYPQSPLVEECIKMLDILISTLFYEALLMY